MQPAPEFEHASQAVSVLLVEDDPDFAALVRRCVAGLSGRPVLKAAETLDEALRALRSGVLDLVLADLGLPDSSGLDTLQRIVAATTCPIIVLTANEEPGIREAALGMGAYEFLHKKDFDSKVLARLVRLAAIQARTFRSLRQSEARFRSLVALSSDFYWEQDASHRVTYVSSEFDAAAGGPASAVLGKRRWESDIRNLSDADWAAHRADLEARRPFRDLELMRRDEAGEERWVAISGEPVFDEAGQFRGYRGIGRDITARKRTGEELLRFRAAIDESGDMIVVIDRATMRYVDVNRTVCRLLGYSRAEMLAMGPQDLLPEARQALERTYDALIADPSVESTVRTHYRCKDGSLLPLEAVRRALKSGERWLIVSVGRDLRARLAAERALEASEARFRSLTQLSSDWYWEQDSEFRLTFMSTHMGDRTGLAAGFYLGRKRWDLPALNLTEADWDRHRAQLARHEPFRDFEMQRKAEDGSTVWLSISGEPVYDAAGEFRGYRGVGRDITAQKAAQAALARFRTAFDRSADMFFLVDMKDGRLLDFNETACTALGYAREELIGRTSDLILADRTIDQIRADRKELARLGSETGETAYRRKDGSIFPVEARRTVLVTAEGEILVVNSHDLTERKIEEERKSAHLRYQQRIAAFGQSAIACRDPQELVEDAVQQVLLALGAETVAYVERGRDPGQLVARAVVGNAKDGQRTASGSDDPVSQVLQTGVRFSAERCAVPFEWAGAAAAAAIVPVPGDSGVRGALCAVSRARNFGPEELNFLDAVSAVLTAGLKRVTSEERLAFLAQFDSLTGLPNRALLADRFAQMIEQTRRRGLILGVLFVDLDDFKSVNDTLGHAAGDELLKEVARRLEETLRPGDTVARISGDEFALVLADLARQEDAALVAQKIVDRLGAPFHLAGHEAFVTASVGIASYPADGHDAETLLGAADAAMYRAKQSGRNSFQFFTAEINQRTKARALLGAELRRALEREEYALVYQPKYDLLTMRPCGAEALLRWKHPERGVVLPEHFVHVLEETGLIVAVGEWVLRRACADVKACAAAGVRPIPVAVNLSARQFRQHDLHARIRALLAGAAVSSDLIELEITESHLMNDPAHAIHVMRALRDDGIRIAIDDFGTGYSSLAYLTRFPVAALKIDRSFVAGIGRDTSDPAIVRTIIEMARTLGATVIAEGVESLAQVEFLRQHGCHQAQGYFFAAPMPLDDLMALISSAMAETPSGKPRPASSYQ